MSGLLQLTEHFKETRAAPSTIAPGISQSWVSSTCSMKSCYGTGSILKVATGLPARVRMQRTQPSITSASITFRGSAPRQGQIFFHFAERQSSAVPDYLCGQAFLPSLRFSKRRPHSLATLLSPSSCSLGIHSPNPASKQFTVDMSSSSWYGLSAGVPVSSELLVQTQRLAHDRVQEVRMVFL